MSAHEPDGPIDPNETARAVLRDRMPKPGEGGPPDVARPPADPEQEAKRIEKVRSHASSHHTAGTVTLDG